MYDGQVVVLIYCQVQKEYDKRCLKRPTAASSQPAPLLEAFHLPPTKPTRLVIHRLTIVKSFQCDHIYGRDVQSFKLFWRSKVVCVRYWSWLEIDLGGINREAVEIWWVKELKIIKYPPISYRNTKEVQFIANRKRWRAFKCLNLPYPYCNLCICG